MHKALIIGLTASLGAAMQLCMLPARASAGEYKVIYTFTGRPNDGSTPVGLTAKLGVLYGTTQFAGSSTTCSHGNLGCGTVFRLTPDGHESILYNFSGQNNAYPAGPLLPILGNLYGAVGGVNGALPGVFALAPDGSEPFYHEIKFASGILAFIEGTLSEMPGGPIVGETYDGGQPCRGEKKAGCGTIFEISKTNVLKFLHVFTGGLQGNEPAGGLTVLDGDFYGTTGDGGANKSGVFFRISPTGAYKVLHSFGQAGGPGFVSNNLVTLNGVFYGASFDGGLYSRPGESGGNGCVFTLDKSGNETVLYSFQYNGDGIFPTSPLLYHNGLFYGRTATSLYSISPSGTFTLLHDYGGFIGGGSNLVAMGGSIFGSAGDTIFEYTP